MTAEKEYGCALCMYTSTDSIGLLKHLQDFHPREFGHFCRDCAKSFPTSDVLVKHMIQECDGKNIFIFRCAIPDCLYVCNKPTEFASHIKIIHKGKPLMSCIYCKQYFTIPFCLVQHIQEQCINRPKDWAMEEKTYLTTRFITRPLEKQESGSSSGRTVNPANLKTPDVLGEPMKEKRNRAVVPKKVSLVKLNSTEGLFNSSDSDIDDPSWKDNGDERVGNDISYRPSARKPLSSVRKMPARSKRASKFCSEDFADEMEDDQDIEMKKRRVLSSFEDSIKIEVEDDGYVESTVKEETATKFIEGEESFCDDTDFDDIKLTRLKPMVVLKRVTV